MPTNRRKIAAHEVVHDGDTLPMHVVVLTNGIVTDMFPLTEEIPSTEWYVGRIEIRKDENGQLMAFHNNKRIE